MYLKTLVLKKAQVLAEKQKNAYCATPKSTTAQKKAGAGSRTVVPTTGLDRGH